MYKACIFDLDGTILNTLSSISHTANKALRELNLKRVKTENFKMHAGAGTKEMLLRCIREHGGDEEKNIEPLMEKYFKYFEEGCTYNVKPYPYMKKTLLKMKKNGILLAVCTNKHHDYAVKCVKNAYGDIFDEILGQKPTHERKPSPEAPLILANALNVKTSECLYVGDTATDMQTGIAAKMFTVGVLWGFRDFCELSKAGANAIIDTPEKLLDFFDLSH